MNSDTYKFVERLPNLPEDGVYLLMLTTRSRLAKEITGDKIKDLVLERSIVQPTLRWRDMYLNAVHNLEELQKNGTYIVKQTGMDIPVQARCVLGIVCPRDVAKSARILVQETQKILWSKDAIAYTGLARLNKQLFSYLHKEKLRSYNFVTIDIDAPDEGIFEEVRRICEPIPKLMITEVSRGWHVVLDLNKHDDAAKFYSPNGPRSQLNKIFSRTAVEVLQDPQEPIPGTMYFRETGEEHHVKLVE